MANGRKDHSPVQHTGSPGQTPPDSGIDQVLHLLDVVVETQVLGAEDGKRTDDAVVTTTGPARRDDELPIADADTYISPAVQRGGQ